MKAKQSDKKACPCTKINRKGFRYAPIVRVDDTVGWIAQYKITTLLIAR